MADMNAADPQGSFVWYELLTSDIDAAQTFYAGVAGWTVHSGSMPGVDYRILMAPDGDAIGGMIQPPAEQAGAPAWRGYIAVDDVDAAVADVVAAGGAVHLPPIDVGGVGRIAMLADPHGATFYVMRGIAAAPSRAFCAADAAAPGHIVWNELTAPDQDAAIAFYADRFGWRQEGAMPMGPLGDYKFLHSGTTCLGAAMGPIPGAPLGWQFYVNVPDIDAAVARLTAAGGSVIQGPDEIPGGSFSVAAVDPQGARFGLVGPREV